MSTATTNPVTPEPHSGRCCGRPMVKIGRRLFQCEECGDSVTIKEDTP